MARIGKGFFRMNLTIAGPCSVGKSIVAKDLSKRLLLKYFSFDEILKDEFGDGLFEDFIKSGKIKGFTKQKSFDFFKRIYESKNHFVFNLSEGAIFLNKGLNIYPKIREVSKKNSLILGLFPSKNVFSSAFFLFKKEIKKESSQGINKLKLFRKVFLNCLNYSKVFEGWADKIVYVKGKSIESISNEIIDFVEEYKERLEKKLL
jgi:deoxyadenosine/deoxycytidine kinase